jgi:lipopolysaccharide transport system permease protein
VKVRYKQTALGVLWVVLQPLVSMAIFTVLFGYLLDMPSGNVPYPVFVFAGLLPWNYFSSAVDPFIDQPGGQCPVAYQGLFSTSDHPISGVTSGLIDFVISFLVLLVLMLLFQVSPTPAIVLLPGFLLLAMVTALGFGLWLGALNVRYRDVNYLVPFAVQMWMYLTPVVYAASFIPERFRWLLALNPMTGVVEGFRWALLGEQLGDVQPPGALFAVSVLISLIVLVTGAAFFRRTERTFADIV